MKVGVCGGRRYCNRQQVWDTLDRIHKARKITLLVQGGAPGADAHAVAWANERGVSLVTFHANWRGHGKAAGPRRNASMIKLMPMDLLVAFPGGTGTADCVRRAEDAGIKILEVKDAAVAPA